MIQRRREGTKCPAPPFFSEENGWSCFRPVAGNREALVAAISCGADAVYLGYTARWHAAVMREISMRMACARQSSMRMSAGGKIYVMVITLVKQCETDDLCDVLVLLGDVNADAKWFRHGRSTNCAGAFSAACAACQHADDHQQCAGRKAHAEDGFRTCRSS